MTRILKIDKINIELVNGKIRLRWTFKGQRLSLSIGDNSEQNLEIAKAKAYQINSDMGLERFNPDDYSSKKITAPQTSVKSEIKLIDLWGMFLKDKLLSGIKQKTIDWYEALDKIIKNLGDDLTYNAFDVKDKLQNITTIGQTKNVLKRLSSCCKYGIRRKLISENNFQGVWEYLPDKEFKKPYCFTDMEIENILSNFANHRDYSYYYDLIVFWLNTGCRPSEALGVKWSDVSDDFTRITFRGSPQTTAKKGIIWSKGSKNYKKGGHRGPTRTIPLNEKIQTILKNREQALSKRQKFDKDNLIFPSKTGKYIDYINFLHRAWLKCVRSIKGLEKTTPYNLRDTFITKHLLNGTAIAVIAAWCDNSPSMIESRYADYVNLAIASIKPINI